MVWCPRSESNGHSTKWNMILSWTSDTQKVVEFRNPLRLKVLRFRPLFGPFRAVNCTPIWSHISNRILVRPPRALGSGLPSNQGATRKPSPASLNRRPECRATPGSTISRRNSAHRTKVPLSSSPMRREKPTTSATRIAARRRVVTADPPTAARRVCDLDIRRANLDSVPPKPRRFPVAFV